MARTREALDTDAQVSMTVNMGTKYHDQCGIKPDTFKKRMSGSLNSWWIECDNHNRQGIDAPGKSDICL